MEPFIPKAASNLNEDWKLQGKHDKNVFHFASLFHD
jgi:hypothetical protein